MIVQHPYIAQLVTDERLADRRRNPVVDRGNTLRKITRHSASHRRAGRFAGTLAGLRLARFLQHPEVEGHV